jgi:hypothetical protein
MSYSWIVDTPYRSDHHCRCYFSCPLRALPGSSIGILQFPYRFRVRSWGSNPMIAAKCDVLAWVEEGRKRKEFRFLGKLLADYITERAWDDAYSLRGTLVKKGSWVAALLEVGIIFIDLVEMFEPRSSLSLSLCCDTSGARLVEGYTALRHVS